MIFLLLPLPNEIWGKGNIFTSVCLSTGRGVMMSLPVIDGTPPPTVPPPDSNPPDSTPPPQTAPPPPGQQAGSTLQECFLVLLLFTHFYTATLILDPPLNNPPYLLNRMTVRIAIRTRKIRAPKTPRRMSVVSENKRCTLSSCSISL